LPPVVGDICTQPHWQKAVAQCALDAGRERGLIDIFIRNQEKEG
jgi:hypothetical protein